MENSSRRHSIFFYCYFSEIIRFDILCESSARRTIHIKCQALFSLKIIFKNQNVVTGALGVNLMVIESRYETK